MTPQLLPHFKQRLRTLLPGSDELQAEIRSQLWRCCDRSTRDLLSLGKPSFFRIPVPGGCWRVAFCLHFSGNAVICHRHHWDSLDQLCRRVHELTGITEIYIRGADLCHRCCLNGDTWIREVV